MCITDKSRVNICVHKETLRTQLISLFHNVHINVFVDTQTPASNDDLDDDDDELNEQPFCDDKEYEASQESNEKEIDEDPPWTPEETESKYANTGDDDDTKECDKPR